MRLGAVQERELIWRLNNSFYNFYITQIRLKYTISQSTQFYHIIDKYFVMHFSVFIGSVKLVKKVEKKMEK